MGRWAGWEGKGGASWREGWEIHWQGCRVIHDPDRQGAVSSWRAPAHEGGAFSSARLPHPQLPWLCPVRVAASLKPKAAPLCAQLPIVPPSSFSLPTYTHTHNLHPQLTSRPEALLPNPATSTLFHTVPPADLPLFSPLLNNLPHRSSCSLGLDSLHLLSSCSQTIPSRPKGYLCFFAFEHDIVPQGEQACSGELCRLCSPQGYHISVYHCRGSEQQQIQLFHKDHTCVSIHL